MRRLLQDAGESPAVQSAAGVARYPFCRGVWCSRKHLELILRIHTIILKPGKNSEWLRL